MFSIPDATECRKVRTAFFLVRTGFLMSIFGRFRGLEGLTWSAKREIRFVRRSEEVFDCVICNTLIEVRMEFRKESLTVIITMSLQ